jgi:arylsulfatase A-like enzyme
MDSQTAVVEEVSASVPSSQDPGAEGPGPLTLLVLAVWCGLISGLLEVGTFVLRKRTLDLNQFAWTSRHFVWLIPLIDLAIFLVLGLILAVLVSFGCRRAGWLATLLFGTLTLLAPFWAAFPGIYGLAGFLLVLGFTTRIVPVLERHAVGFGRMVRFSFPVVAGIVLVLAASLWSMDWVKARREEARPLPSPGSPNVLLIVLDTVGAGHLSLHGYSRRTSPTIDELAARGVRFDRAIATSSWTLPSHASLLTGRWPHELSAGWFTPLDGSCPTLAEFLGSHGYATAGFVANEWYCASDSGLARGFTEYRDYAFPRLTAFKTAGLINRTVLGVQATERFLEDWLAFDVFRPVVDHLGWLFMANRKEAAVVNREFLDWLSRRRRPERPFFAFLNFYDAHYPYELPKLGIHRFRSRARGNREADLMRDWMSLINRGPSQQQIDLGRDYYDDCVADLDEQLGRLIDELDRRSILERTWVIITSDHGESFGEQSGMFWHGTSLYQTQIQVPLVIIPPAGGPSRRVVTEVVSLRDMAATIVDVLGVKDGSPFPGDTLARFWNESSPALSAKDPPSSQVLSEVVPLESFGADPSEWIHKPKWPLAALTEAEWTYIRREGDVSEELFHVSEDAQQRHNLAGDPAMKPKLDQMREVLGRLTAGPLTPRRFKL